MVRSVKAVAVLQQQTHVGNEFRDRLVHASLKLFTYWSSKHNNGQNSVSPRRWVLSIITNMPSSNLRIYILSRHYVNSLSHLRGKHGASESDGSILPGCRLNA